MGNNHMLCMKTGILGKKGPCEVKKKWINSPGLKWSMKNTCYMDFTCLVGDLCYSSKLCFFPPLCCEDRQWFSLAIYQDSAFSIEEVKKATVSRGLETFLFVQSRPWVHPPLGGKPLDWQQLCEEWNTGIYKSITAVTCYLPLSQHRSWNKCLGLMQLFLKWSRR